MPPLDAQYAARASGVAVQLQLRAVVEVLEIEYRRRMADRSEHGRGEEGDAGAPKSHDFPLDCKTIRRDGMRAAACCQRLRTVGDEDREPMTVAHDAPAQLQAEAN